MSTPPLSTKWACEYCTYENWPASKKCTLCRAARTPQLISDVAPPAGRVEQDIYKMAPLVTPTTPPGSGSVSPTPTYLDPNNKWPCQACTYLNWPKAIKCTQCLTTRPVPVLTRPVSTDPSQPLSINVNIAGAGASCSGARGGSTSPNSRTSPNSPEAAKAANNDRNRAIAAAIPKPLGHGHVKWTCKACTYENWPKSQKCVLCGVTKGKIYNDPQIQTYDIMMSPSPTNLSDSEDNKQASARSSSRSSSSRSPPGFPRSIEEAGATASAGPPCISSESSRHKEKRLRQIRNRLRDSDWLWLQACLGVVEGDGGAVEAYLAAGGDPGRQLSADESSVLARPSAFEVGYTLVHLAIRFQREDMLAVLLTATDVVKKAKKRVPSHVAPDLAADILREVSLALRQRKGDFPCYFLTEASTFVLPADIADLPLPVRKQLLEELLDQDVQKELEEEESVINWSLEITERLGSRLYALWNRTAGDCLLDSVLQASWGVFDRDNSLRRALADSLCDGATMFYPRWKEAEAQQAQSLHFSLDESQWQQDWGILLNIASQPGSSLEQIHIFALSHILRRPIIVYGIKFVKSFRGENLGFARFQGVYLPLLWESSFCWRTPIALGYTRGHFSALVPMEVDIEGCIGAGANTENELSSQVAYLPLMDPEGKVLPIHFLPPSEAGREETVLREWLDCNLTDGGLLVAQQKLPAKRPILVKQMLDEWLERYRRLASMVEAATNAQQHSPGGGMAGPRRTCSPPMAGSLMVAAPAVTGRRPTHDLSSDDETDDE